MYCKNCGGAVQPNQEVCLRCGVRVGTGFAYCQNCANPINPGQVVCVNCGFPVSAGGVNGGPSEDEAYNKLGNMEKTSSIVWIIIGILQIISLVGVICGIWNIVQGVRSKKAAENILQNHPSVYKTYQDNSTMLIICAVLNFFFGALIGLAGVAYDFYIRSYVLQNKAIFDKGDIPSYYGAPQQPYQAPAAAPQYNPNQGYQAPAAVPQYDPNQAYQAPAAAPQYDPNPGYQPPVAAPQNNYPSSDNTGFDPQDDYPMS